LEKHVDTPSVRVIHNIEDYGNMSASTVALTLDEVLRGEHGDLPDPALIVLTAIGGGYTTAAAVIEVRS
jgi:3-oxoacyl-[acyl-carrier-protein] synthase III